MITRIRRCLFTLICILLLLFCVPFAHAEAVTEIQLSGNPWCNTMLFGSENPITPETIIIYLHGDQNNGYTKEHLDIFGSIEHPVKYAREGRLYVPDDTIFICFQGHGDGDFRARSEELETVIHALSEAAPSARILLAGHSHGSFAAYKIAAGGNPDIDGYIFISGNKPGESETLELIPNCLVIYGKEPYIADRDIYANLFPGINISDSEYSKDCAFIDDETNNGYILKNSWDHCSSVTIFLEDFFWEWLDGVTNLSEVSN